MFLRAIRPRYDTNQLSLPVGFPAANFKAFQYLFRTINGTLLYLGLNRFRYTYIYICIVCMYVCIFRWADGLLTISENEVNLLLLFFVDIFAIVAVVGVGKLYPKLTHIYIHLQAHKQTKQWIFHNDENMSVYANMVYSYKWVRRCVWWRVYIYIYVCVFVSSCGLRPVFVCHAKYTELCTYIYLSLWYSNQALAVFYIYWHAYIYICIYVYVHLSLLCMWACLCIGVFALGAWI